MAKPYVRLTQPLVRDTKGGELRPATWDEALDRVVAGFQAAKAAHGPTTFGTFSCSKATNEVNFAAQKFSRPGPGQQQHRQLQPDLTRPERRRSGDRVRCRWRHKFIP